MIEQADYRPYLYPDLKPMEQDWRWFDKYPAMVLNGDIPACEKMKQAAERHFRDRNNPEFYLDEDAARSIVAWFKFCPIVKGPSAGRAMVLDPSQIWMAVSLIAWKWSDDLFETDEDTGEIIQTRMRGKRRFNQFFALVSRKYGKTSFIAGIKLYIMYKYGFGPRVYSLATKKDQAKEVWSVAKKMIKLSPRLSAIFEPRANDIIIPSKEGEFKALASDSNSLDGLDPVAVCLDECHAIKDRNLYGVLVSAFGSNEGGEFLFSVITTAGFILDGLCTDLYKNGERVLRGEVTQDNYFYAIFEIDKGDDWSDERAWRKSNPGLVFGRPSLQYLRDRYQEATMSIAEKANFLTKHCNKSVNAADKWLDVDAVAQCVDPTLKFEDYKHRECVLAFDRSLVTDVSSLVALFPEDDGGITCFWWNLQTEAAINAAGDYLKQIYFKADASGHLQVIRDSKVIRDHHVRHLVTSVYDMLPKCEQIAYDPYKMKEVALQLEEAGYPMLSVSQGPSNLSEPSKKVEGLIADGLLRFNGDKMFLYACECAEIDVSKPGNVAVYKRDHNNEKIDPLAALLIALSCATLHTVETSVYNQRGMLFI